MKKLVLALCVGLAACQTERSAETAEDTVEIPIGPGTDSSALASPDTPMSSVQQSSPTDTPPQRRKR